MIYELLTGVCKAKITTATLNLNSVTAASQSSLREPAAAAMKRKGGVFNFKPTPEEDSCCCSINADCALPADSYDIRKRKCCIIRAILYLSSNRNLFMMSLAFKYSYASLYQIVAQDL